MPRSDGSWNSTPIPRRVTERAFTRWTPSFGCWISTYSVASHGYAQIGWQNKGVGKFVVLAHRASWEHVNGRVPVGMTLDHLCRKRRCVNPSHLRLLSNFENARRVAGMDWPSGQCSNGHPDSMLKDNPHRRDKRGNRRVGKRCRLCVKLYKDRERWRISHAGTPYPDHLMLRAEREKLAVAS